MKDKLSSISEDDDAWPHFGTPENKPIVCIIIGMAGTGKTTFMQRINAHVSQNKIPSYIINLDPAVSKIPYKANIDIRDSVNYKETMKQYKLGPNGGILTSLNLFSTRFDQVMGFVQKRASHLKYIFVDTPGQIEVFNWSASGTIITDTFASCFPTVYIYIVDTPRCSNPTTFMSNMLYACSILYKTRLPLLVTFNKIDVVGHEFCLEWMQDCEVFLEAVKTQSNYMGNFTQSMSLVLQEFYNNLTSVGVSAISGIGMEEFFHATLQCQKEYERDYKPELIRRLNQQKERDAKKTEDDIQRLANDMNSSTISHSILSSLSLAHDLKNQEQHRTIDSDDDDHHSEQDEAEIRQEDNELADFIRTQDI